jgi:hypothetical protein
MDEIMTVKGRNFKVPSMTKRNVWVIFRTDLIPLKQ